MRLPRLLTTALALAALAPLMNARQLTVDEALAAAGLNGGGALAVVPGTRTAIYTLEQEGLNTVYVVPAKAGFAVLAADDVAPALLAYSPEGSFDPESMPSNLRAWLDDYSAYIAYAATHGCRVVAAPVDPSLSDIAPMTATRWNQDAPYNNMCPLDNGEATYTGCVATATAQVVKTYECPTIGTGTYSYTWTDSSDNSQTLSFDYGATAFAWNDMKNIYNSESSTASCEAVAQLMYALGVCCDMDYGTSGSGAHGVNMAAGLIRNMGYDKSLTYLTRDYYPLAEWTRMLHAQLLEGHPIYYDGANNSSGHAFVIDGYRKSDGFFHLNWGWGGLSDGYYSIITLSPGAQGIGGSTAGYFLGQSAIFGLKPAEDGSTVTPVFVAQNILPAATSYAYGNYAAIGGTDNESGFFSLSLGAVNAYLGAEFTPDGGGDPVYVYYDEPVALSEYGSGVYNYYIPTGSLPVGNYTVRPVAQVNGQVYLIRAEVTEPTYFTAEVTAETVTFTPATVAEDLSLVSMSSPAPFYRDKKCFVNASVKNEGAEYYGMLTVKFTPNGSETATTIGSAIVDILTGDTADITVTGTAPFAGVAGTGYLRLYDGSGNQVGEAQPVEFGSAPSGTATPTMSNPRFLKAEGSGTQADPYIVNPSDIEITADLSIGQGYFTSNILAFVMKPEGGSSSTYLPCSSIICCYGDETVPLTFEGSLQGVIAEDTLYYIMFAYLSGSSYTGMDQASYAYFKADSALDVSGLDTPQLALLPNPAGNYVAVTAPSEIVALKVFDVAGIVRASVKPGANSGRATVDIDHLNAGNYFLQIVTASGTVNTLRFIKK